MQYREFLMPKRKQSEQFASVGEKDCWHSYSLQSLAPARFVAVVGKILRGKYLLANANVDKQTQDNPIR